MAYQNAIGSPYEVYTSSANTWTGIWAAAQSLNYIIRINNNIVTFDSINNVNATANTASIITNTELIPARFRPSIGYNKPDCYVSNNSVVVLGRVDVNTDGTITVRVSPTSNFTGSGTGGFYHFSVSWPI